MTEFPIWQRYNEELYQWIQRKYQELSTGKITKERYYEYLAFYESELQLVMLLVENDETIFEYPEARALYEARKLLHDYKDLQKFIEERFLSIVGEDIASPTPINARENTQTQVKKIQQKVEKTISEGLKKKHEVKLPTKAKIEKIKKQLTLQKQFRVLFIGSKGAGKTTVRRIIEGKRVIHQQLNTVGASMSFKDVKINGDIYKLIMIDIGDKTSPNSRIGFYKNADAIVYFFDVNDVDSFYNLDKWLKDYSTYMMQPVPIYLVGTKHDLKTKVKEKEVKKLIKSIEERALSPLPVKYFKVSEKKTDEIQKMIKEIIQDLLTVNEV